MAATEKEAGGAGAAGADASSSNPLSRKLSKILDTRLDSDKDMLEALRSLSTFFVENNLRARRNLRSDIEKRSLAINDEFLAAFRDVKEQLDSIYVGVKAMNECCADMTGRLVASKHQVRDLIDQTTQLQSTSSVLQMKAGVVDAFLRNFHLNPDEVKALRGVSHQSPLTPEFFAALKHVKQIHQDCKLLLRTNRQTAGLEIMESMAMQQEAAFERLYRWTQAECRLLTADSPEIAETLSEAMAALQDRPVLFSYCLDEFSTARRAAVVRGFIDALTRGGAGGTPRPIELHSHDSLRYVGDMLAWLHQAVASEREHLQTLLRKCSSAAAASAASSSSGGRDAAVAESEAARAALTRAADGVCRPLRVRIEQVLVAETVPVSIYRLDNLLRFYAKTIRQVTGEGCSLVTAIDDMCSLCNGMFYSSLGGHMSRLLEESVELPAADLSPAPGVAASLALLQDILACQDASVLPLDARRLDFVKIVSTVVEPLLKMCTASAARLSSAADMATYMVNCLQRAQVVLSLYEFTEQHLDMLSAQIDAHLGTLVGEQTSLVLGSVGLSSLCMAAASVQSGMSSKPGLDEMSVKVTLSKFDGYLASPDAIRLSQVALLSSASLRETVTRRANLQICQAYGLVYAAIGDPRHGYREPVAQVAPRTPAQVRTLLAIQ